MKRLAAALVVAVAVFGCSGSAPVTQAAAPVLAVRQEPLASSIEEARAHRNAGRLESYEADLRSLATSSDARTARRAAAMLGLFFLDQKRYDDALPLLAQVAQNYPQVGSALRLRISEAEEQRGDIAAAIAAAEQITLLDGGTAASAIARLRLPALYAAAGQREQTDAAYARIANVAIDELTEEEFVRLADRLAKVNRADLANSIRMRMLTQYTSGRWTEKLYGQLAQFTPSPLDTLSIADASDLANRLTRAGRLDQALQLLQRMQGRFPEAASDVVYNSVRLRSLFNARNYTELVSATTYETLTDPSLVVLRARAAWRANQPEEFLRGIAYMEQNFPGTKDTAEALVQRSKFYVTDVTDYAKSIADLKKAIDAGIVGSDGENIWNLGWTYTLWGLSSEGGREQFDEALRVFDRYVRSYPDGDYRTNSLFWAAKINGRIGRGELRDQLLRQVIAEYPYSYYAYRSREIAGLPSIAPSEVVGATPFPDVASAIAGADPARLAAVDELLAIDLPRDATREMKQLAASSPENVGLAFKLADVYVLGGEPFRANSILQRSFRNIVRHGGTGVPQRFWEILYPLAYWDRIKEEAVKQRIDPYQVTAIIRQESGFEPTTVSNAGAVGLMQIMPAEAERLGAAANIPGVTRESLFDPDINIAVGAAEFRQKLDRMQDNTILAIAAYNAGETAVGRWLTRTPVDDIDLFVDSIPFAETRLYVKTVTRNRFEYRRIYEGNRASEQSQHGVVDTPASPPAGSSR